MILINSPIKGIDYKSYEKKRILPVPIKKWAAGAKVHEKNLKTTSPAARKDYIDKHSSIWRDPNLVNWLLKLSHHKCWYTEVIHGADYPEVEHFRPKKLAKDLNGKKVTNGYYWLAFNLTNYRLCKSMPNRKKGSFFPIANEKLRASTPTDCHLSEDPLFLDPLSPLDCMLISFNDNGKALPALSCSKNEKKRASITIKRFGLNHAILNRRRKLVWNTCRDLYYEHQHYMILADQGSVTAKAEAALVLKQILYLIHHTSEFSATARASLSKIGSNFAQSICHQAGIPDPARAVL